MAPEDWLQAEMQGEIVALVHSHPGGLPWLSEADRRLQVQSDLPWWLVCRGLRCRIFIAGMTGGVTVRISILTIWRLLVFTVSH